jgi:NAD(P)-dependent dehydrogenase (short-subunit alcohol dehydrogenase family)
MDRDHRTLEVAFVTGANQGIGFHTALQLCKLPGYHIIVGTRTRDAGKETIQRLNAAGVSSEVCFIVMDLDSDASIASAVGQILMKFGRLDILVVSLKL